MRGALRLKRTAPFLAVLAALAATRLPILFTNANVHLSLFMDDSGYYLEGARRALETHSWPSMNGIEPTNGFHPLYMLFLIAIQAVAGTEPRVVVPLVMALQLGMGAAAILLVAREVARKGVRSSVLWVGLLLALDPGWLEHGLCGLENGLSSLLLLLAALRWERRFEMGAGAKKPWGWTVDGALLGLAVAARTDSVLFAAAYLALGAWRSARLDGARAAVVGVGISGCVMLLVLAPWIGASLARFGTFEQDSGVALAARYATEYGSHLSLTSLKINLLILCFWWFRILSSGGLVPLTGWGLGLAIPVERWRSTRLSRWVPWAVAAACGVVLLLRGNDTADIRNVRVAGIEVTLGTLALIAGLCSARPEDRRNRPLYVMLGLYATLTIGAYSFAFRGFQPWYSTGPCLVAVLLPIARALESVLRDRRGLALVLVSLMAAQSALTIHELLLRGTRGGIHPHFLAEGTRLRDRLEHFTASTGGRARFACFDSGKLSYVTHPFPITNADGVMNHRAAHALVDRRLDAYLAERGVTHIIGEPERIAEFAATFPFRSAPDSSLGRYLGMEVSRVLEPVPSIYSIRSEKHCCSGIQRARCDRGKGGASWDR